MAGYGASADAHHPTAPDPEGRGICASQALRSAGASAREVDHVDAHGTSAPLNDRTEVTALHALFGDSRSSVTSAKGVIGHAMGAASAIEPPSPPCPRSTGSSRPRPTSRNPMRVCRTDVVTGAARAQHIALAVSNSFGCGGHNTVLAFRPGLPPGERGTANRGRGRS
ncbi:hypothetical protein [Streptomyces sp. NPDC058657]|uniref:hypothetical protein n=1 Tax=unclassified Streptomyces TaxID=2593676 RepID=UPI00364F500E